VATSHDLELRTEAGEAHTTLAASGEIDYGNVASLRSALLELIRAKTPDLVVDLADVSFIDSTALSVLVQAKQRLESNGGRMAVSRPQPRVARVLQLAGLEDYLVEG
jgi:anti-sigma B factor antagonist